MENKDDIIPEAFIDKEIVCVDCQQPFIFSSGEQAFFWTRRLADPKRCKDCRVIRRRSLIALNMEQGETFATPEDEVEPY